MLSNGVETAFFRSLLPLQSHELLFYGRAALRPQELPRRPGLYAKSPAPT